MQLWPAHLLEICPMRGSALCVMQPGICSIPWIDSFGFNRVCDLNLNWFRFFFVYPLLSASSRICLEVAKWWFPARKNTVPASLACNEWNAEKKSLINRLIDEA